MEGRNASASAVLPPQAAYYLSTGIWPLLSERSFQAVTGPKAEMWLVKTVGVLVAVIGVVLGQAHRRRAVTDELVALSVGSAVVLGAVDTVYVAKRRISPVYLVDALAQAAVVAGWARGRGRASTRAT